MGRPKKYNSEEERKQANREKVRKWRAAHKDKVAEYRKTNKDKIAMYQAKWYQANRDKKCNKNKELYYDNIEKERNRGKKYYQENKEVRLSYNKMYRKTPYGRALYLINAYVREDRKQGRIGDELPNNYITPQWIVDNIFSKPCHYCGESDWLKIGCDRIDNSLPHTIDNVIPCCGSCNRKRHTTDYEEFKNECMLIKN